MISLAGLTIINTRPISASSERLTAKIASLGAIVYNCPVMEINPLPNHWETMLPSQCQWLIFISANAVENAISTLKKKYLHLPPCIAIGKETANTLEKYAIKPFLVPTLPTSESLLKELPAKTHDTVVIIKGIGGRKKIAKELKTNKINVLQVNVYERRCPKQLPGDCQKLWQEINPDLLIVTSVNCMDNLFHLLEKKYWHTVQNTPWLVMSKRIALKAKQNNVKKIYIAPNANLYDGLLVWADLYRRNQNG
jgi:uroporphyrinogen-III synthase